MSTSARSTTASRPKSIVVDALARVEGEGGLTVLLRGGKVADVKLRIYEPPRFFEAFLRGRGFREVPDITARICGICPVAYQMSSVHAMEAACGVKVERAAARPAPPALLRRVDREPRPARLHAPRPRLPRLRERHPHGGRPRATRCKKALRAQEDRQRARDPGRGARDPPDQREGGRLLPRPRAAGAAARSRSGSGARSTLSLETVRFAGLLEFPDFEQDYEFVSLRHPDEYPFNEGRIVSNKGLDIPVSEYEEHFIEEHVPHSNALHSVHKGHGAYHVGPLARYSLNFDRLPQVAQEAARAAGLATVCRNPFKSIVVRAVELVFACHEALRIIEALRAARAARAWTCRRATAPATAPPRRRGACCTTATGSTRPGSCRRRRSSRRPRRTRRRSRTTSGTSCPRSSTCRRRRSRWQCEQAIRNYDPCISCATHFLRLDLQGE